MAFKLSQRSLDRMDGVDERMIAVVKYAITETKVDFGVICGLRTIEEQRELVAKFGQIRVQVVELHNPHPTWYSGTRLTFSLTES